MRYVIGRLRLRPGRRKGFMAACRTFLDESRREAGCIFFEAAESSEDADAVLIAECWVTPTAHELHLTTEHYRRMYPRFVADLLSAEFEDIDAEQVRHTSL